MDGKVWLVGLALVPFGVLLLLNFYVARGEQSSSRRRRQRNLRAMTRARQRATSRARQQVSGRRSRRSDDDPGRDDYLHDAYPSDSYFDEAYVDDDDDDGALRRGLLEDEADISHWPEDDGPADDP